MPKKDIEGLVAVIYARYSSENQREESIEGQLNNTLNHIVDVHYGVNW